MRTRALLLASLLAMMTGCSPLHFWPSNSGFPFMAEGHSPEWRVVTPRGANLTIELPAGSRITSTPGNANDLESHVLECAPGGEALFNVDWFDFPPFDAFCLDAPEDYGAWMESHNEGGHGLISHRRVDVDGHGAYEVLSGDSELGYYTRSINLLIGCRLYSFAVTSTSENALVSDMSERIFSSIHFLSQQESHNPAL